MYNMLKHAHSGIRWIVLILIIYAIINALMKWQGKKTFTEQDRKINLFTMISAHIQLLTGLALYFISPKVIFSADVMKNAVGRFFTVEHILIMTIAIVLITIGNKKSKTAMEDITKFKKTFWFFLVALLLILVSIPWPFMKYGGSWF